MKTGPGAALAAAGRSSVVLLHCVKLSASCAILLQKFIASSYNIIWYANNDRIIYGMVIEMLKKRSPRLWQTKK